jgi:hypothetical protein
MGYLVRSNGSEGIQYQIIHKSINMLTLIGNVDSRLFTEIFEQNLILDLTDE